MINFLCHVKMENYFLKTLVLKTIECSLSYIQLKTKRYRTNLYQLIKMVSRKNVSRTVGVTFHGGAYYQRGFRT